jgi:hypothetical protein
MTPEEVVKKQTDLKSARGTWESHWQEIAELVLPSHSTSLLSNITTPGAKRRTKQFDATPELALNRFAAAMESMLTPRNSRWHILRASNKELNNNREVSLWFDEVTDLLFQERYSPKANYASQQHEHYISLGAFGTGGLFIDGRRDGGIRYKAIPLGSVVFEENHEGVVDSAYRRFKWTARKIIQRWESVPDFIRKAKTMDEFEIVHCVAPRDDIDPSKKDFRSMPFMSMYVLVKGNHKLSEGGYFSFPYNISRYVTAPGEIYGRSPAMIALPSIKTLNEQKKTILKQGHRVVDPVLLAHDDGVLDSFSLKAGAINYGSMTSDGKRLVDVLPTGNLAAGEQLMNEERSIINDAFLVSLFQILIDSPQMTATEVLERAREKGALLSPTMGRQQSEALGPMIERELDILGDQGILPEMPGILKEAEGEFTIEYDSPLSRAQKAEEASGLFRTIEAATAYANITGDLSPFDHIDIDEAIPALMKINAVPEIWRRTPDEIAAIRQNRQDQQDQQTAIQAAPAVAGLAKNA